MTAEFAAVLPAVVLVLAFALGSFQLASEQLRLQSAVGDAARLVGRGDDGALAVVRRVAADARLDEADDGDLVCVTAEAPADLGILAGITLSATACALRDGG